MLFFSISRAEYIKYTVNKGDTFYSLSKKFNVDIWVIQKENGINTLRVGEIIKIPVRVYQEYKVKKGDTLFSISKRFNTTIEEIISANKLTSLDLKANQLLIIPSSKKVGTIENKKFKRDSVYVVKPGDTLYSISKKTGVSLDKIRKLNRVEGGKLKVGEIIVLEEQNFKNNKDNIKKVSYSSIKLRFELPVSFVKEIRNNGKFVEIVLTKKDKVKVINSGEVVFVGTFSIFGNTVIVKHSDNLYSIYGMMDDVFVKSGDKVQKGEVIGTPSLKGEGLYSVKFSFVIGDKMVVPSANL
ncbi:MAG: LysM peptidoglycan-binding domain-containing protein [Brevinematia bacterium]